MSRRVIRLTVAAAAIGATLLTAGLGAAEPAAAAADTELVMLLRFMAAVKALLALTVLAASVWRLGYPASAPLAAGYVVAPTLMCAALPLIWQTAHVSAGAALFHGGVAVLLLVLYLDRGKAPELAKAMLLRMRRA